MFKERKLEVSGYRYTPRNRKDRKEKKGTWTKQLANEKRRETKEADHSILQEDTGGGGDTKLETATKTSGENVSKGATAIPVPNPLVLDVLDARVANEGGHVRETVSYGSRRAVLG